MTSAPTLLDRGRPWSALTQSYLLADLVGSRANNFNLIRFFAASLVIFSHCHAIAYGDNQEPIHRYFGQIETGGSLGVLTFFSISGYLVTQSFIARGGRVRSFLAARALRIYPGLIAAVIFSIVAASFANTLPLREFLQDPQTLKYLWHNARGYPIEFALPGAFIGNPLTGVNGSLWTLPLEMQLYLVCATLGILGLFSSREIYNAIFAAILLVLMSVKMEMLPITSGSPDAPRFAAVFLFGAYFYINRQRVRISIPIALGLVLAMIILHKRPDFKEFYVPAVGYIVLVLACHPKLYFATFNRLGDYSYGLYIYAFPIQQLFAYSNRGIRALPLFWHAYPVILGAAVISWHLLEKPALKQKPG